MPIVDVEIVVEKGESLPPDLAISLAEVIGAVLTAPPGRTWVRLRTLLRERYAEHGGTPDDIRPVFVTVLKSQRPAGDAVRDEVARLTSEVARLIERSPDNVHILYEPDARGRIAFGGNFVE